MSQEILKSLFTSLPKQERIKELDTLASILNTHHKATLAVNFICTTTAEEVIFPKFFLEPQLNTTGLKMWKPTAAVRKARLCMLR